MSDNAQEFLAIIAVVYGVALLIIGGLCLLVSLASWHGVCDGPLMRLEWVFPARPVACWLTHSAKDDAQ